MKINNTKGTAELTIQFLLSTQKKPFQAPHFKAKPNQTYFSREQKTLLVGLGDKPDAETYRKAAGTAIKVARQETTAITIDLPNNEDLTIKAIIEGLLLGNYRFLKYKTQNLEDIKHIKEIFIPNASQKILDNTIALCDSVNYARDLVNLPPADLNPKTLEEEVKQLAKKHALKLTVFDEQELKKRKMNAIVAVGQGSEHRARMFILEYKHPKANKHIIACGKGVCYDSGGYNLKMKMIEMMKDDMGGAAALLGTLNYIATTKQQTHLTVIIGAVENLISHNAYKPGDVVTAMNGKTIEIANTDAEGRIVLADCLSYASTIKHDLLFDIATLTGASMVALGTQAAALCTHNDAFAQTLADAGNRSGDRIWRLPLYDEYKEDIKSDIADMKNLGTYPYAGVQAGAVLLEEFVKEPKNWFHIDMGCTVADYKERAYTPKGPTGWGVRILSDFLTNY